MKRSLGVDLHRTQFTVCTRLENGRTYLRQWLMKELKLFAAQLKKEDELAVEATSNTRLARKFLGVLYHTLKNNWVFEYFPNFVLAS